MIKRWLKKIPIVNSIHKNRLLSNCLQSTQVQLLEAIERLKQNDLSSLKENQVETSSNNINNTMTSITASLTSYGQRINTVHLAIISILNQSLIPTRVILWLAKDEFTKDNLPKELLELENYGLEIAFCRDIRSYKKLIPTLKKYPGDIVITFDDDIIYRRDTIERLYQSHLKYSNAIICHRGHLLLRDTAQQIKPYGQWDLDSTKQEPNMDIFPVGLGGILYPKNSLSDEVFNENIFMTLCPTADDLWFKCMALKNGTFAKVVNDPISYEKYVQIPSATEETLWEKNKHKNDQQLEAIINEYPEIKEIINSAEM